MQTQGNPEKINVLITAASRRVALTRYFRLAVEPHGGSVITVDYDSDSPALYFGHRHYNVPLVSDPRYLPTLLKIVDKENVSLLIPSIDQELLMWAENKDRFREKGVHVSISPPETIQVCNDKWATFQFFKSHDIPFSKTYLPPMLTNPIRYPLFIKPRGGRGSVNSFIVKNKRELNFFLHYVPDPLVQDYLLGDEFTVDAFFDFHHKLIAYVPRYRLVVRAGVSDRGRTFKNKKLEEWIVMIGKQMKFEGAVNIQGKVHDQEIVFFEINPRFSGGIQLSTNAGPNFPQFLVDQCLGKSLEPQLGNYTDNLLMTSYEDSLFLDTQRNLTCFSKDYPQIIPNENYSEL